MRARSTWLKIRTAAPVACVAGTIGLASCQSTETRGDAGEAGPLAMPLAAPGPGASVRVGGDMSAQADLINGAYRAGSSMIDTPLPEGYPGPTPPGAIEIKTYPPVRLAEVERSSPVDRTMNGAFWPLFNHIKKHNIEMTSPVEMNYRGMTSGGAPESWSMAFLYRTAALNEPGREGEVIVRDQAGVTVLAVGLRGNYSMRVVERGMETLETWLGENPDWEACGDWRSLYYNGPMLFSWRKWAEVQIPIRRRAGA